MLPRASVEADPIPGRLNIALAFAAWSAALGLLWLASHAASPVAVGLAAFAFALVNNTIFALTHEAVHRCFHPSAAVNEAFGMVSGAFFPLGLSLQRVFHLGHHQRNRTRYETFDYYFPEDSSFLKRLQWYGILSGIYWVVALLGSAVFFFVPVVARARVVRESAPTWLEHTSGTAFLRSIAQVPKLRGRIEILGACAFQLAVFALLDLRLGGWLACYGAFALVWSGLQYVDHAFSPLDVREGAWNLRVPAPLAGVLLNYHLHLAHHRRPGIPWLHLPRHVEDSPARPGLFALYGQMWLGPRPAPASCGALPEPEVPVDNRGSAT